MRDILDQVRHWQRQDKIVALATLVDVEGSAPRSVGARLAITRSGAMAGSVSAGCVEADVVAKAMQVLDTGRPDLATYALTDEDLLEVGLGCAKLEILIEPLADHPTWPHLTRAVANDEAVAAATVTAPQELLGRQLVALADGGRFGSVHADIDESVVDHLQRTLAGQPCGQRLHPPTNARILNLQAEGKPVALLVEHFPRRERLFIVGATDVAVHLTAMAAALDFHTTIVDPRPAFANRHRFAAADEIVCRWPQEALGGQTLDDQSYVVALSHDSKFDLPSLTLALQAQVRYVGALGSRRTHAKRCSELARRGVEQAFIDRIHGPIGLDIGADGPREIALAIAAQLIETRRGKATSLSVNSAPPATDADRSDVPVNAVILAAGRATRMGETKQLLPIGGRTLLQHVIEAVAAAACIDETVVVLGAEADTIRTQLGEHQGVRYVVNPDYSQGLSSSLRYGLAALPSGTAAAAVVLGDQPGVNSETIDRVVSAYRNSDKQAAHPVYRCSDATIVPGHPVVIGQALWADVEQLRGDTGARALLAARPEAVLQIPCQGPPPADIDTPHDYRQAVDASQPAAINTQPRPTAAAGK